MPVGRDAIGAVGPASGHPTRTGIVTLLALTSLVSEASPGTISGTVRSDGDPVAGARVMAHLSGESVEVGTTADDGAFAIDVEASFSGPDALDTDVLVLMVTHPEASNTVVQQYVTPRRGHFSASDVVVSIEIPSGFRLTEEVRAILAEHVSPDGRTVFLLPYEGSAVDSTLDEIFKWNLYGQLTTQLCSNEEGFRPEIALELIDLPVSGTNPGPIRACGDRLNALAMISGVRHAGEERLDLLSQFLIMPHVTEVKPPLVLVQDQLLSDEETMMKLSWLSKTWTDAAALAIGLREFADARGDPERLAALRTFLSGQLAGLTGDSPHLSGPMNRLVRQIDEELGS